MRGGLGGLIGADDQVVAITFASLSAGFCPLERTDDHVFRLDRDERVGQGQRGVGVIRREQRNRAGVELGSAVAPRGRFEYNVS